MLRKMLLVLALIMVSLHTYAQVAIGVYPHGTFDSKGFDTINVGNLNVHFSMPVINKPGRGMPFYYTLNYDSSVWNPIMNNGTMVWAPTQNWGWQSDTNAVFGSVSWGANTTSKTYSGGQMCYTTTYTNFTFYDSFGGVHSFPSVQTSQGNGSAPSCVTSSPTSSQTAPDGSGYTLQVTNYTTATIVNAQGFTITPSSISDTNGNQITASSGVFTDTLGVKALTIAGASPNNKTYTYTDRSGNAQSVTVAYVTRMVQTAFGCSGIGEYGPTSTSLVSSITFPQGYTYSFTYETTPGVAAVTGRIASITLPTGGTISYQYTGANNGISCTDGSAAGLTRTLSASAGSAASTATYVRNSITASSSHTDVTDGATLANHSAYNFVIPGSSNTAYETSRSVYNGAASGTPALARNTCYNGATAPCTTKAVMLPLAQIDTYESLNGGFQHGTTAKYNSYGLQTEQDIYDYGTTSARGNLLRKEVWAYPSSGIVNLVSSDTATDGSGNQISQTTYAYDETSGPGHAALVATSGLPQHGGTVGSQRGNLTTMTQWNNLGTAVTTTSAYEDTGNPVSTTTPNGTSSFAYDSATHAFVITSTPPTPSSGVSLPVSATNDATTGLPLTATDANGQQTTYKSYDALLRPTEIDSPDGGKTTFTYSSPNIQYAQTYLNSSTSGYVYSDQDAYGRADRISVYNGQSSNQWYQQDICFDGNGNAQYKTYPYQGTGLNGSKVCSASAGDTYAYDALGRVTSVTHADNTVMNYTYTGRATKVVDENKVTRITQVDGLGRTTTVCEVSSSSQQSVAPVNCGQDIAATGFLTTYKYSTDSSKDQVTTIIQGAASQTDTCSSSNQCRTFVIDSLGRTVSVTEPERGTTASTTNSTLNTPTTYSYTYNSTGLVVTRKRPKANQPYPTTLTTTTTQYDALGRILSVSYDDNLTIVKNYSYDKANWAEAGSQTNLKGRLSLAWTGASWTGNTGTLYSYDAMGRTTSTWQCVPSGCGTSSNDRPMTFTYDWAGNLLSQSDPYVGNITYGRSPAGEITSVTNQTWTLSGSAGTANILSNAVNGPNGPISYNYGNGLSQDNTYDSLGRINGGWVCIGAPSAACPNQRNGFALAWSGARVSNYTEDYMGRTTGDLGYFAPQYDDFNRLTGVTQTTSGPYASSWSRTFSYVYDRYGNRWQQNAPQGGPSFSQAYNAATNQLSSGGYTYDAAGNMTSDTFHTYTYDAEGNILQADSGQTAVYIYDALNHKVQDKIGSQDNEYIFDLSGRVTSNWLGSSALEGHIFADGMQVAYRANGQTYFNHKEWLNTDRVHTDLNGATAAVYTSLPWGDGGSATDSEAPYAGWDFQRFGDIDFNWETSTYLAQFRTYSQAQGRWLSPDPYDGSYDLTNPQSYNRYAYVLNNPLSLIDPSGLDTPTPCVGTTGDGIGTLCQNVFQWGGLDGGGPGSYPCLDFGSCVPTNGPNNGNTGSTVYGGTSPAAPPTKPAPSNAPTISNAVCTGAAVAAGASAGALIGEGVGGFLGGLVGAGGGTLVAPGVGTVGGGIAGGSAGAGIGAGVGGFLGGLAGGAASNVLCSKGGGSSFGGNQRENKQANDAKNEAERMTGKKFTRAQERVFHDEITGQNYGYHELVQIAVQVLQGVV